MQNKLIVTLILVIFGSASALADVYSWRDENGVLHFGDKPESVHAAKVDIQSKRTDREQVQTRYAARQEQRTASSEEYQSTRADEAAAAAAKKLSADEQAAACTKARDKLKSYINARRLYREDEDGNPVYLESTEMDAARASAEADVAKKCR